MTKLILDKCILKRIREALLTFEEFIFLYSAHNDEDWDVKITDESFEKLRTMGLVTARDLTPKGHAEVLEIIQGPVEMANNFERFWEMYPDRAQARLLKKTSEKDDVKRLYTQRADEDGEDVILNGAESYCAFLSSERTALKYAYGIVGFLNKRAYLDFQENEKLPSVKLA